MCCSENGGASRDGATKAAQRAAPTVGEAGGSLLLGERGKGREGQRPRAEHPTSNAQHRTSNVDELGPTLNAQHPPSPRLRRTDPTSNYCPASGADSSDGS